VSKFGLDILALSSKVEEVLTKEGKAIVAFNTFTQGGMYLTPEDAVINLEARVEVSAKDIRNGTKRFHQVKKKIGLKNSGEEGLKQLALAMGYKTWSEVGKVKANKKLHEGKVVFLYEASVINSGSYSTSNNVSIKGVSQEDYNNMSQAEKDNLKDC